MTSILRQPRQRKFRAVADYATGFVQTEFAGSVVAEKAGDMAGGLERGVFGVALFAAERVVDFGMADDAIGHFG